MGEKKIYGSPPAAGHLPKTQVRGRAGQLTWRGGAVPTGRPGCRPVTRAYLGFELFQKTVWRLAAARLQHRPKREAQKNSIARGLARPGGDEGVLRVWIPAGFLGSAVSTALAALAPPPRDSAFWAGAARHPAPPPPRPARGCPGLGGWGGGGREGRGRGAERAPLLGKSARRCVCSLVGPREALWVCVPGAVACGRRERIPHAGLRTCGCLAGDAARRSWRVRGCGQVPRFSRALYARAWAPAFPHFPPTHPLPGLCARLPLPTHEAVCFCWVCQCCLCSGDCVIA